MALDDGTRELKRALTDPDGGGGGGAFEAAITDDEGILSEILARLPVKSVMRFRCVCKPWRALIAAPYFRNKHFQYAESGIGHNTSRLLFSIRSPLTLDLDALKNIDLEDDKGVDAISEVDLPVTISDYPDWRIFVLGSCNGLVCLFIYFKGILIWNPSTSETSNLLPIPPCGLFCSWGSIYGFGYDSSTEDYKILIAATTEIYIFALKTGSWKTLPNAMDHRSFDDTKGLFLNGALHWLVLANFDQRARVVSFNLEEEGFQEMVPLPDNIIPSNPRGEECAELLVLGNCLCLVQLFCQPDSSPVCIVTEYGVVTKSWTQVMKFSIGPFKSSTICEYLPFCILKHGMVLVQKFVYDLVTWRVSRNTTVMLLVNQTTSKIIFEADIREMLSPTIYRESLVSPVTLAGSIAGHQYQ